MDTITLDQIKNTDGVLGTNEWKDRVYINVGRAVTKVWLDKKGKLHIDSGKGLDSDEAIATISRLIGCSMIDRYTKAAAYVEVRR